MPTRRLFYGGVKRGVEPSFLGLFELFFQFHKRRQPFIGTPNETPSIIAMCVSNPDRSPLTVRAR